MPDSTSSVVLSNTTPAPLTVTVSDPPKDAVVHDITIAGNTDSMTLSVIGESTLFANSSVVVGNNGILDVTEGGNVTTHCLEVESGGTLMGNGRVVANVSIGVDGGTTNTAVLRPGASPGTLEIEGDLLLGSSASSIFEFEGETSGEFDEVTVTGNAVLGGVFTVDVTNFQGLSTDLLSTTIVAVTAASIAPASVFETVMTVGDSDVYFAPNYGPIAFSYSGYPKGDMNRDGAVDILDIPDFTLALTDPMAYNALRGVFGAQAADFEPDFTFDFDDIDGFVTEVAALSSLTVAQILDMVSDSLLNSSLAPSFAASMHGDSGNAIDPLQCGGVHIPEPATVWLLILGIVMVRSRRNVCCVATVSPPI